MGIFAACSWGAPLCCCDGCVGSEGATGANTRTTAHVTEVSRFHEVCKSIFRAEAQYHFCIAALTSPGTLPKQTVGRLLHKGSKIVFQGRVSTGLLFPPVEPHTTVGGQRTRRVSHLTGCRAGTSVCGTMEIERPSAAEIMLRSLAQRSQSQKCFRLHLQ